MFCQYCVALDGFVVCFTRMSASYPFVPRVARHRRKQQAFSVHDCDFKFELMLVDFDNLKNRQHGFSCCRALRAGLETKRSKGGLHSVLPCRRKEATETENKSKAGHKQHTLPLIELPPTTCRNGCTHGITHLSTHLPSLLAPKSSAFCKLKAAGNLEP